MSRALIWAMIMLVPVAGCMRWEPYRLPAPARGTLPTLLRVWWPAGSRVVLTKPFLRSDRPVRSPCRQHGRMAGTAIAGSLSG